ncbi:MAG: hypothetical protein AAF126_15005, partial [Chloroflexota bacterium]
GGIDIWEPIETALQRELMEECHITAELEVSEVNGITFYTNTMLDIPRVFFEYNGEIIEINVISVGSGITAEQQAQNLSDALDLLSTIREEG